MIVAIGEKFNRWTVLSPGLKSTNGHPRWNCRCECGIERLVCGTRLRTGASKSCGCLNREVVSGRQGSHRMTNTKIHKAWGNMLNRCINPRSASYKEYGGRGIAVCAEWLVFEAFLEDMYESFLEHVNKYGEADTSLDRIDNDSGYYFANCRWATRKIQQFNRRVNRRNRSGYVGVCETEYGTWRAALCGKSLGSFPTKDEAVLARVTAEQVYLDKLDTA